MVRSSISCLKGLTQLLAHSVQSMLIAIIIIMIDQGIYLEVLDSQQPRSSLKFHLLSPCVSFGLCYSVILVTQPELIFLQDPDRSGHRYSDQIQIYELGNAPWEMLLCILLEKCTNQQGKASNFEYLRRKLGGLICAINLF